MQFYECEEQMWEVFYVALDSVLSVDGFLAPHEPLAPLRVAQLAEAITVTVIAMTTSSCAVPYWRGTAATVCVHGCFSSNTLLGLAVLPFVLTLAG